ncbi:hypothetical protein Tco_0315543 [Tanacetum coccineum]
MLEDIKCKDSYDSNLDESTFTPLSDLNEDECVDPGDDIDEIDAFYHDSEGDIHYLESLLSDNITLNLPPKDCPDFEGSRARCFVHRSLALQILSMLILGIRYPKSYRLTFIFSILNKRL